MQPSEALAKLDMLVNWQRLSFEHQHLILPKRIAQSIEIVII
jgi:hypothetical protein